MSRSTVSNIVSSLEAMGIVRDVGEGLSKGGRRPILVGVSEDSYFLLGVEMGASHLSVVACSLRGELLGSREESVRCRPIPREHWSEWKSTARGCRIPPLGLGWCPRNRVGSSLSVHDENPGRLSPQILPEWAGIDLISHFHKRFQIPVFMENDANLGAVARAMVGTRD